MFAPTVEQREQTLDIAAGATGRACLWHSERGDLRLDVRRMTSFLRKGLFVLRYQVSSVSYRGGISLRARLNADVRNHAAANDPRVAAEPLHALDIRRVGVENGQAFALATTQRSGLTVCCRAAYLCDWATTQAASDKLPEEPTYANTSPLSLSSTTTAASRTLAAISSCRRRLIILRVSRCNAPSMDVERTWPGPG